MLYVHVYIVPAHVYAVSTIIIGWLFYLTNERFSFKKKYVISYLVKVGFEHLQVWFIFLKLEIDQQFFQSLKLINNDIDFYFKWRFI